MRRRRGHVMGLALVTVLTGCATGSSAPVPLPPGAPVFELPRCDDATGVVAAYTSRSDLGVELIDVFGLDAQGNRVNLTDDGASGSPRFSPDGSTIVFTRGPGGSYAGGPAPADSLWLMNSDGTNERLLVELTEVREAEYSPDGSRIAFSGRLSVDQTAAKTYVMNADGTDIRRATVSAPDYDVDNASEDEVAWSPDGTELAFVRWVAGQPQVGIVSVDTGAARMVHSSSDGVFDLSWSARGDRFLFTSAPGGVGSEPTAVELELDSENRTTRVEAAVGATYLTANGSEVLSRPSGDGAGFKLVITTMTGETVTRSFEGPPPAGPVVLPPCAIR